jgi:hypothetical protein
MVTLSAASICLAPIAARAQPALVAVVGVWYASDAGTWRCAIENRSGMSLSAWTLDVVDEAGTPQVTVSADTRERPDLTLEPGARVDVDVPTDMQAGWSVRWVAALSVDDGGLGDERDVQRLRDWRASGSRRHTPHR